MKRYLIIALAISYNFIHLNSKACGGGEYYYEYKYLFPASMLSDTSLVTYFFTSTSCEICGKHLRIAIIDEWQKKYPNSKSSDIEAAIFQDLNTSNADALIKGTNPNVNNTFYNYLLANNQNETIEYLNFIAYENAMIMGKDNSWESNYWDEDQVNEPEARRLLATAQNNFPTASDNFIKQRYIFQIIKLYNYLSRFDEAISFFEKVYPKNHQYPLTLTYYRTLGYYAGAKRKTNNLAEAKYLFATVFDKCLPIRYQAYKDYKYIDLPTEEMKNSLELATLKSERAAMLTAESIYSSRIDVSQLRTIYENDSSSYLLELALIKQLNTFHYENYIWKLKDDVILDTNLLIKTISLNGQITRKLTPKPTNWWARIWQSIIDFFLRVFGKSSNEPTIWENEIPTLKYIPVKIDVEYIGEYIDLLDLIMKENKVKKPALFVLAKGYLQIVKGNFKEGQQTLQQINTIKNQDDPSINHLAEYLIKWSKLLSAPVLDETLENEILVYLLKNKNEFELEEELSRRYLFEKQFSKAFQSLRLDNKVAYFNDEEIKQILDKSATAESKEFVSYFGKLPLAEIKDQFAKRLFLRGEFEESSNISNLDLEFYQEGSELDEDGYRIGGGYSQPNISFRQISDWNKQANGEFYLKIAEALGTSSTLDYNSTPCYNYYPFSYNNASKYPFNSSQLAETIENRINYDGKLKYSTDLAESFYRKAHDLLKSDEEKAYALVRAQEVAMHDKYIFKDRDYSKKLDEKSIYYKELKTRYGNTEIVKTLNNSCSFFRNELVEYY